ncbi:MAG: Immunoglobulin-like repeat containing protein domain [Bacteroidota bacterium]|nr:Immunoglobulin-like repeat containing protein domain [Bacteroidota bacterium]
MNKLYKTTLFVLVWMLISECAMASSQSICNWQSRAPFVNFWDSCSASNKSLNGYIYFGSNLLPCFKFQWTVNGINAGTSRAFSYPITQNGTYNVCVSVIDTCNNCDTSFCSVRTITCIGGTTTHCNWGNLFTMFWDSCTATNKAVYGYATLNSCWKYQWKVNGVNAGTTRTLTYPVTQNGSYNVCLTVSDTCSHCDTTICSMRGITCISNTHHCNWANLGTSFFDTCNAPNLRYSVNGYSTLNSCWKYQWRVNGVNAGTGRILHYPVTQNGTYNVCLTVIDTCNNCDTSICSVRTITCIPAISHCNWTNNLFTSFWDSCTATNKTIYGYASLNSCWKYQWKVNGVNAGTTRTLVYQLVQNGTYNVCLTVTDTCTHCDTTICSVRGITCIPNTPHCNWANLFTSFFDTCNAPNLRYSVNGYSTLNSCWKYQWKVNGVNAGTGRTLHYPVTQNGTYNVCLTVIDTCNNCDTSICSIRTITCIPTIQHCNWTNLITTYWDTCTATKKSVSAYVTFNACYKYQWKVNGVNAGTDRILHYPVQQNGTYNVCLTVIDTCAHCDTTICSARILSYTFPCNWSNVNTAFWDTCDIKKSLNGYIALPNTSLGCYKFQWKVNGQIVSTARILHYPVTQNGTYVVCVSVTDTCNHCDTTICSTRILNCVPAPCNWSTRHLNTAFWDSCTGTRRSVNAYAVFQNTAAGCYKYLWKVNGAIAGTTNMLHYTVLQNGTYVVCLTVIDTCNHCDTTICSTRVLTCTTPVCNWSNRHPYTSFWDTCTSTKKSVNGYIAFNSSISCLKFQWTINGVVVSHDPILHYPVTQNGTYHVCVIVTDTCDHCDTSFCSTRILNCVPVTCSWSNVNPVVRLWDTCTADHKSLNGYVYATTIGNNCYKYQWKVNGNVVGTGVNFHYTVTQNGTYSVCVTVIDTCGHCDTSLCSTRIINCVINNVCNWSGRHPYVQFRDSCSSSYKSLNGYIGFVSGIYNCYKFQWTVNGQIVGTSRWLTYPVTQNGTYNVCVTVIDSCDHCDTSFCSVRVINCSNTPHCNWSTRHPYTLFTDSCTTRGKSVNGYIAFNSSYSCLKFQWKVNGHLAGTDRWMHYSVTENGTYNVCVTVTDTCDHCDTTFCSVRIINCPTPCIWSSTQPHIYFWDSCYTSALHTASLNAYISPNTISLPCFKYIWKVNGVIVGTGRILHYPVLENGTYNVCVSIIDSCNHCDTSFCTVREFTCARFAKQQIPVIYELQVYPNPSHGSVNLFWSGESTPYTITDITGAVVGSGELFQGNQLIDMSTLSGGIYILHVQSKTTILTKKISLEN